MSGFWSHKIDMTIKRISKAFYPLSQILLLLLFNFLPVHTRGALNQQEEYAYHIIRADEPVKIDGLLSEKIWDKADIATDFWMSYPVDDRKADVNIQTEVRLVYDDHFLYLGVVCYGDSNYIIQTLKRDTEFSRGDAFGVVIDPVNEKTNGFTFGINPAGVQTEFLITGQTGRRQNEEPGRLPRGINIAWDNKWFSEVTNYPDRWIIEIAIPFRTLRFEESKLVWGINFFRLDAKTNSIHSWAPVPIEFRETDLGYTGSLHWDESPGKAKRNISLIPYVLGSGLWDYEQGDLGRIGFQPGIDSKISLTSSLNFDVTINPDFSQVEVDEQVTNLTLFDIRLPEKRLFFLENSDIFEDFGIPPMRPFFSRKIGLDEEGIPIPILFGARLSGNMNKNLRLGLMNLQTRKADDLLSQNYTAVAIHQQVFSRSIIKGYFFNRQALNSPAKDYNRNAGLEMLYRSTDGRIQSFAGYARSFSPGIRSKSFFYNLGAGYDNKNISAYTNLSGLGTNYVADMGFLMGQEYYDASRDTFILIGYNHWFTRFSYTFYPENNNRILSHELGVRYILDSDSAFSLLNNEIELNYTLKFFSTGQLQLSFNHNKVNLLYPFSFIDQEPLPANIYMFDYAGITFETDQRKRLGLRGGLSFGSFYNGTHVRYLFSVKYRAQPWGNFAINFEQNDLNFPEPYGREKLLLISPRIEVNFSKSLFWTTFLQYNTQEDNFNINTRLQWRFQPMSDIYIVYTDNYALELWGPKNRVLVFKLNYWFNL